jgi:starch synthase (maltosyl-transferring)
MDQVSPSGATYGHAARAVGSRDGRDIVAAPRIYYIDPLRIGPIDRWDVTLAHAAALGFTHVLTAPLFAGPRVTLPADFAAPHPALAEAGDAAGALRELADKSRSHGLALLMDVDLGHIAAGGQMARERPDLFADAGSGLDPRAYPASCDAALPRPGAGPDAIALWWGEWLGRWREAGLAGFRLLSLDIVPAEVIHRLAASRPGLLLGWTIGLPPERLLALQDSGLDHVFGAAPRPGTISDAVWTEAAALRRIAPMIACPETPYGPRLAAATHDAARMTSAQTRAAALAAAFGDGWMMPMGFEFCARRPMDPRRAAPPEHDPAAAPPFAIDLAEAITAVNAIAYRGEPRPLLAAGQNEIAFLRADGDPRYATSATLTIANANLAARVIVDLAPLMEAAGGRFRASVDDPAITLAPGEVRTLTLRELPPILLRRPDLADSATEAAAAARVGIEAVSPTVEHGLFPAKRGAGEIVTIACDLLCDGHDKLSAVVKWREADTTEWTEVRMRPVANDRWSAAFPLRRVGRYDFMIEAWRDVFASYRDELGKKHAAGVDVRLELMEGRELVTHADAALGHGLQAMAQDEQIRVLLSPETAALMASADARKGAARTRHFAIEADRLAARFASWYEIFPRSMSDDPVRHGTFRDVIRHLPRIRDMGFDVLYFPPIHPIGQTNRKGRNNALKAAEGDVGSPYAIGGAEGGHDALHPDLGSFEDFQAMRAAAEAHGLELALDFAIQCSPDHPWLKEHRDWFAWRPDGSMKYAENPPKKYEDIVNVDFYAEASIPSLWVALCEVVLFWAEQGVRIIRVDNPHTKPFPFWHWMIAEVRARYPDMLFLAEAFTRPKIMNRLGKLGFSQSYTYFTWRNTKRELQEYLTELTADGTPDFFRPNFFVNTPDINPPFLQTGGRPAHLLRAALAATLSGLWGVYCGFELCEATPLPGREEYLDSEKYQIRVWDWHQPGNIVAEITALNRARRMNPALQTHLGLTFLPAGNDQIMLYEKATPDRSNVVIVAVSLDPARPQTADIELPLWKFALPDSARLAVQDLMDGRSFAWDGKWQTITLNPSMPFALWRVRPAN